jgi:hypothetical protein
MNQTLEKHTFKGSPDAIGSQVFSAYVMPVIDNASRNMPPKQLMQLYWGFMSACLGSMAADFGKDQTQMFIDQMAKTFETFELTDCTLQ